MNLNKLKRLYTNSPQLIKKLYALIPFSLRNGGEYRKWLKTLQNETNSFKRNPFDSFDYARKNFQFYKILYSNCDIEKWEDIPLIDKLQIQSSLIEFERVNISKFYVTTGGVTGNPAKFFQSNNVWYKELAFVSNFFGRYGYKPMDVKLSLRGGDFSKLKENKYWIFNPINNEIHFSPFHLNNSNVRDYVNEINRIKPKFFHSYPSGLLRLTRLMLSNSLKLEFKPSCIFLISESFTINELEFLKGFFNCEVTSFYGHSERLIFAPYDPSSNSYSPDLRYGYFELIDKDGKVICENNVTGEIVGTSFDNYAMPLIRYKTGDFAHYVDFESKTFGPIEGKWGQDFLVGRNGEQITITALNLHSNELNDLIRLQFHQVSQGFVRVLAQFRKSKSNAELISLSSLLSNRVGLNIEFEVLESDEFKSNLRGKVPLVIR